MTVVTYSSDPTWHPRFVLAVVEEGQVICRPQPLKRAELGEAAFQRDAAELLGELRQLQSGSEVPRWVRWRGLCVGLEEVPQQSVERLFMQPLPARVVRAA